MLSNVPGFQKPVTYFGGKRAKKFNFLGSGSGNTATSITICSILKRAQIVVTSDESQIEDVPAFVELFNKEILRLGIQYEVSEEGDD